MRAGGLPRAVSVRPFCVWLRRHSGVGPGGLRPLLCFEEQTPNHFGACSIDNSIAQNVRRPLVSKQLHQFGLVAARLQLVQDLREALLAHLSESFSRQLGVWSCAASLVRAAEANATFVLAARQDPQASEASSL
jgi:hypothetical protein